MSNNVNQEFALIQLPFFCKSLETIEKSVNNKSLEVSLKFHTQKLEINLNPGDIVSNKLYSLQSIENNFLFKIRRNKKTKECKMEIIGKSNRNCYFSKCSL